jgi:hypothetical protein
MMVTVNHALEECRWLAAKGTCINVNNHEYRKEEPGCHMYKVIYQKNAHSEQLFWKHSRIEKQDARNNKKRHTGIHGKQIAESLQRIEFGIFSDRERMRFAAKHISPVVVGLLYQVLKERVAVASVMLYVTGDFVAYDVYNIAQNKKKSGRIMPADG